MSYVGPDGSPIPGEVVIPGEFDGTVDGWEFVQDTRLVLNPPVAGQYKLLVEFDAELLGFIPPIKVHIVRTSYN
jgi:hypothetical protein